MNATSTTNIHLIVPTAFKTVSDLCAEIQKALQSCKDDNTKAQRLSDLYIQYKKNTNLGKDASEAAYPLDDLARALIVFSKSSALTLDDSFDETLPGDNFPEMRTTKLGDIFRNALSVGGRVDNSIDFFTKTSNYDPMFVAFGKEAISFANNSIICMVVFTWCREQISNKMYAKENNIQEKAKIISQYHHDFCLNKTKGIMPTMTALSFENLANALKAYSEGQDLQNEIAELEQDGMGYSSKVTTISAIFKDAISADGKVANSTQYFNEGQYKNPILIAFSLEATSFVKKEITNL